MKTLQRLQHVRPLGDTTAGELRAAQLRSARKSHRALWWRWFRRTGLLLLALVVALVGRWWLTERRLVVDGLVRVTRHVGSARFEGRVVEVLCEPGQRVERGTPLVRIEPLLEDWSGRRLELALDEARLRLELALDGATLSEVDPLRRSEARVLAALEVERAQDELQVLAGEVAALEREREALAAGGLLASARSAGRVAGLEQRARAEGAAVEAARAREAGAQAAARASAGLAAWDVGPKHGAELDRHRVAELEHELRARSASADQGAAELAAARREAELEPAEHAARIERATAELASHSSRRSGLERRAALWGELAKLRGWSLEAGAPAHAPTPDPARVRALELELLALRVADAEAALEAHAAERGNGLLLSEQDGVVERVLVEVGATVAAGTPLVATHDPCTLWIEAFVPDGRLRQVAAGMDCRLLPRESRLGETAVDGWVRALGGALVPRPEGLPRDPRANAASPPWNLPVEVNCLPGQAVALRPNQTVKVVFGP